MHGPTSRRPLLERPIVRGLIAAAMLLLAGALIFALQAGDGDGDGAAADLPESRGPLDDRAPVVGEPAPDFELSTIDGDLVTLSDLRGQVVWLNFWATWCRPCRQELPEIQALYDEMREDGLVVLEINYEEQPQQAQDYWEEMGLSLPLLLDGGGDVYGQYRLQGLPDSFFIDREGNLAAIQYGFLTEEQARDRLAQAGIE